MYFWPRACTAALLVVGLGVQAHGAGGAFFVDNAGVDDPSACKVETWTSFSQRHDFVGALAPTCAVSLGQPVELGVQFDRLKFDGEWKSGVLLRAKTSILPFGDESRFGIALTGGTALALPSGKTAAWFLNMPMSFRVSDPLQINLHVGAIWDRIDDRSLLTWGVGFELSLSEPVTLIGEIFSFGSRAPGGQIGLRYTPVEQMDLDVIYGRNLAGEQADWITLGVNVRF
jgi:hypothetical protein